jgi:hypothetical protein
MKLNCNRAHRSRCVPRIWSEHKAILGLTHAKDGIHTYLCSTLGFFEPPVRHVSSVVEPELLAGAGMSKFRLRLQVIKIKIHFV